MNIVRKIIVLTILITGLFSSYTLFAGSKAKRPVILLRSGWQVENIGDIAHTPGFLALTEKYIPKAEVIFWPYYHYLPENEVAMLKKRFPKMKIVLGKLSPEGVASTPELAEAISKSDILINNSGPATIGWADLKAYKKATGKPIGVYGVTYGLYGMPEKEILSETEFVFFRDTVSLDKAKKEGIDAKIMTWGPDAAFATDVEDETKAKAFLKENNLETGKFVSFIPKHRMTPVWLHEHKNKHFDADRNARNEAMKEHDHAPMIEAITAVVRQTNLKVLIVSEDETQISIGKDWIFDKLPEDVKPRVVWRNTGWLTDEAVSIYKRSAGLVSHEQHSPIMCIGHGIPALLVRWEEQSSKGYMWNTIGLQDWLFDFDKEADIKRYVPTVLDMVKNPKAAKAKANKARKFVQEKQKETMKVVENSCWVNIKK
ncbi:polysaccharide pyruvyl transferase family protein [Flavobacterium circumlabens]|uniref:Polysaccharide pyruvyl transferase WcaK-like protein n=1 Tax=Flavobacterium circumlabens TaxID=2133765 RepID=A0A4Y7UF23_9FLAO|nr:polysaccharide pyruvyl transferase family protein [Flavobacterium circumlabens]TCN59037.1 polysaccharide pyruvyl transferase WcaK-like protein [Flavobacterium circumlabens]TEB44432.1 polysaccharide pyruvyl transferase family protein [Flavobacterium circumlabens]